MVSFILGKRRFGLSDDEFAVLFFLDILLDTGVFSDELIDEWLNGTDEFVFEGDTARRFLMLYGVFTGVRLGIDVKG